jgi:hypothetical protein
MEKEKIKFYPEKHGVSIRGTEWTLWIRKVQTKDGRTMFNIQPLNLIYNEKEHTFHYEELKKPIWLKPEEIKTLIGIVAKLTESQA